MHGSKPAWLDAKRTSQENKPARLVHRVCEVLQTYEDRKPDRVILDKQMPGKKVLRSGVPVGSSLYGRWRWEAAGLNRYTDEERKHAEEWAAQE